MTASAPSGPPRSQRRRRPAARLFGALLLVLVAATVPSCRAASRWGILRMTHAVSECDSTTIDSETLMDHAYIDWRCSPEGLDGGLLAALARVADEYGAETGRPVVITSGARTLQRQAELMAQFSQAQLEGMYCRHGYPGYIRQIVNARDAGDGTLGAEGTYEILRNRDGGFISSHLCGAAVDISPSGADVGLLKRLLEQNGFTCLDERSLGVNCIHATFRDAPRRIVRE